MKIQDWMPPLVFDLHKIANEAFEMLIFLRRKTRAISRDVVTNYHSSSILPHDQAFVLFWQSIFSMHSEFLVLLFFFFFQPSNYSALLQSFCISSQRSHHLNDEERESCACRLGSCTLQSQPAWDWGSHNDQSSWSFTDWLLKQSHCLCISPQKEGTFSGYLGKANVVIDTLAAQEASQSTAWRILCLLCQSSLTFKSEVLVGKYLIRTVFWHWTVHEEENFLSMAEKLLDPPCLSTSSLKTGFSTRENNRGPYISLHFLICSNW